MDALSQYIQLYDAHGATIDSHAPQALNRVRPYALAALAQARLPRQGEETYPALSVNDMFAPDYGVNINRVDFPADAADTFRCGVPNISTLLALVVNDTFRATASLARNLPAGVKMMSLAQAAREMPELVEKYYNTLAMPQGQGDPVAALNALLAQDGVLVHVSAGTKLDRPLQIVNIFNAAAPVMGVRRLLIIIDDDAAAQLLLCDHSTQQDMKYLSCQVAEVFLGRNASLDYYDLEESSPSTSRYSQLFVRQSEGSRLVANGTTLVGGVTRNNYIINIAGEHADTKLAGMAVCAGQQVVDNCTLVRHDSGRCDSQQMFKYILNDQARGSFYGTIIVDERAKHTNAYQSNRNILASNDARMYTRPQLEIYCDEVKCSHGATVGQLDANALFYMRSRGIPLEQARMMLMQAFMADVIDTVTIPALKSRLHQLIERRLAGEWDLCADCQSNCAADEMVAPEI